MGDRVAIKFPLNEFFTASGNAAYLYSEQLRDGIAGFACDLWGNFPQWMTQNSLPATSFARGFYNQMCSSLQPPVTAPSPNFTGGQCPGTLYLASINFPLVGGGNINGYQRPMIGPIAEFVAFDVVQIFFGIPPQFEYQVIEIGFDSQGNPINNTRTELISADIVPTPSTIVTVLDAGPNNCGDPPPQYPIVEPTVNDLSTTINITNLDGVDNNYDLVVNQVQNNYNFPIGFKLNGVNVTLDLSGITIHGNTEVTNVTLENTPGPTDNSPPPPGTDGGQDGIGNPNNTIYDGQDYPTLPDFSNPETIVKVIEYVLCIDGVINLITDTIKVVGSSVPFIDILVAILKNVLEDICDIQAEGQEAIVGLPEWYGIRPGANRPAIVFLWKEYIADVWQKPTYSSTVSHPSAFAIGDIPNIPSQDKTLGTFVASLTLTDGSRIRTSGDTEVVALNNFNFLLNQVDAAFIPAMVNDKIIISENQQLQVKTVKLRQIEYYPQGGGVNRNPTIRRVIDP